MIDNFDNKCDIVSITRHKTSRRNASSKTLRNFVILVVFDMSIEVSIYISQL